MQLKTFSTLSAILISFYCGAQTFLPVIKATEFNQFLTTLYRERQPGQAVADLYPRIVAWFREQGQ